MINLNDEVFFLSGHNIMYGTVVEKDSDGFTVRVPSNATVKGIKKPHISKDVNAVVAELKKVIRVPLQKLNYRK